LPADWRQALRSPFTANFHARLEDAGSIAALAGEDFGPLGGTLFLDGELHGADNRAEGYCNFSGIDTRIRELTLDWIKGCLLFEGQTTRLASLEARGAEDRIQLEGSFANSRPHAYKGRAEVEVHNLSRRLGQLGIMTASSIGGGAVKGIWEGSGNGSGEDIGTFRATVSNWVSKWTKAGMSGSFTGLYAPGREELTKAEFFQDDLKLSLRLAATKDDLTISDIRATRGVKDGKTKTLLEGTISLPVRADDLWVSGDPMRTLSMERPLSMELRLSGIRAEEVADLLGQRSPFAGQLEGALAAKGKAAAPELSGTLRIGRFTPTGGESIGDLTIAAESTGGMTTLRSSLDATGFTALRGSVTLPLRFANRNGSPGLERNEGKIDGTLELDRFPLVGWTGLLGEEDRWAISKGTLNGHLSVSGTMMAQTAEGSLVLKAASARLAGSHELQDLSLPVDFHGKTATVKGGKATYAKKPLSLEGGFDWGAESREGSLRISGSDLPFTIGPGLETTAKAELSVTMKESAPPLLSGTLSIHPIAGDLSRELTPSFVPPSPSMPTLEKAGARGAAAESLNLDIAVASDAAPVIGPRLHADLRVSGNAADPSVTGKITLLEQTLQLPSGLFLLPEIALQLGENGTHIVKGAAVGFTRTGPASLEFSGTLDSPRVAVTGLSGVTAPDLVMALATGRTDGGVVIRQGASWVRQAMLFPVPALAWATGEEGPPMSGTLGFYGSPWIWSLGKPATPSR
jgi:hypothetical protein